MGQNDPIFNENGQIGQGKIIVSKLHIFLLIIKTKHLDLSINWYSRRIITIEYTCPTPLLTRGALKED